MSARTRGRRIWRKLVHWASGAFILGLFAIAALSLALYGTVHHTAQPEFCNTCHIMEPYYKSWQASSHKDVACIECHYEPGALETLEGKFKALSQLAKYVTRTAGTKPWAEVSDQSCMRSGCHSVRMLDGTVPFGNVSFNHRHHLLESRRGRRLQCVTCHSQIVQGQHIAVTSSVCFTCHFMPGKAGEFPEQTGNCMLCHGPPKSDVVVEGRPFQHGPFVERGVACRECHDPVVQGDGAVRKERCHSCHAETGRIERIGETAFLHEMHVTKHKVECFECHDPIRHGLLPLEKPGPAPGEGCGACHENSHDAARELYTGTGAVGVEASPSRMFQTRVVCEACHTGRTGFLSGGPAASDASRKMAHHPGAGVSAVAAAGNADCIHCHGTGYDGLLTQWQAAVSEQVDRLRPMLEDLEKRDESASGHPARAPLAEARHNFALVTLDGSRGAHNVSYALDALRASAARIDGARALLGDAGAPSAAEGFPFRSKLLCTTCHAGAGRPAAVWPGEKAFPHQLHLTKAGLDCNACHSTEEHGKPAFPRTECGTCHHQETSGRDVSDCASCHSAQEALLRGTVAGAEAKPGLMGKMECTDCHGEAPDVVRPKPGACVVCHKAGYDEMELRWQKDVADLAARVESALAAAGPSVDAAVLESARKSLAAVKGDGSRGVHNFELARSLLEDALHRLRPD